MARPAAIGALPTLGTLSAARARAGNRSVSRSSALWQTITLRFAA